MVCAKRAPLNAQKRAPPEGLPQRIKRADPVLRSAPAFQERGDGIVPPGPRFLEREREPASAMIPTEVSSASRAAAVLRDRRLAVTWVTLATLVTLVTLVTLITLATRATATTVANVIDVTTAARPPASPTLPSER